MDGRRLFAVLAIAALASLVTVRAQCSSPYIVQPGDTLFNIAQKLGVTEDAILAANPQITDPDEIFPDQSLTIRCPTDPPSGGDGCNGGFQGDATFYFVGGTEDVNSNMLGGFTACGERFSNLDFVAALSFSDFDNSTPNPNNSPTCSMCAQVCGPVGTTVVRLKDKCAACQSGDIDLSPAAFSAAVGNFDIGRQPGVRWGIVPCP